MAHVGPLVRLPSRLRRLWGLAGSQRLRDAAAAYLLGDMVAWDSMESDAAAKDALLQDLIHLAREKAERVQIPVEWEATEAMLNPGKVLAIEEVFHVVTVSVLNPNYDGVAYIHKLQYMNRHGQWGSIHRYYSELETVTVKTGWFSKKKVFRMSWSDEPPQPGLDNILKRAAELLTPAA